MAVYQRQGTHQALRSLQPKVSPPKHPALQSFCQRDGQGRGRQQRPDRWPGAQGYWIRAGEGSKQADETRQAQQGVGRGQHRLSRAVARRAVHAQKGHLRTLEEPKLLMFIQPSRPSRSDAVHACGDA